MWKVPGQKAVPEGVGRGELMPELAHLSGSQQAAVAACCQNLKVYMPLFSVPALLDKTCRLHDLFAAGVFTWVTATSSCSFASTSTQFDASLMSIGM